MNFADQLSVFTTTELRLMADRVEREPFVVGRCFGSCLCGQVAQLRINGVFAEPPPRESIEAANYCARVLNYDKVHELSVALYDSLYVVFRHDVGYKGKWSERIARFVATLRNEADRRDAIDATQSVIDSIAAAPRTYIDATTEELTTCP